jgi:CRP/FNR family cyclic AMP-dependent transcriptional regulator
MEFTRSKSTCLGGFERLRGTVQVDDQKTRQPIREIAHNCVACSARPASIFCDLDSSVLSNLDPLRTIRTYPARTVVFMESDQPQAAYCLCSGRLKLSSVSAGGKTIILGIATPGDVLGARPLLLGKPHDVTAETIQQTQLCSIRKDAFLNFARRHADVSLRLAGKLSSELSEAHEQIRGVALKQSSERLTDVLLELCQTHGEPTPEGITLQTNFCQEELAALVGVSRRTLNRALAKLRCLGIIDCGRRSIRIRNRTALRNWLATQELPPVVLPGQNSSSG